VSCTRHIGDFTRWKEHDACQKALGRLPHDLRIEKVQAVGEEALWSEHTNCGRRTPLHRFPSRAYG
jgi:hypothetical protein